MSEKHIPVFMSLCFFCGSEKSEILIGKRAVKKEPSEKAAIANYDPCETCKEKMDTGILFLEMSETPLAKKQPKLQGYYPTGNWVVVNEDAVKEMVNNEEMLERTLKSRKAFMDIETFSMAFRKVES